MATQNSQRLQVLQAVTSVVAEAAESQRMLHTAEIAAQLAKQYSSCGMTRREIEDEVIRQVGLAHGVAEIGYAALMRPPALSSRRSRLRASPAAVAAEQSTAEERSIRR